MKFKDLKIGDNFHWKVGDSLLKKVFHNEWEVVGQKGVYRTSLDLDVRPYQEKDEWVETFIENVNKEIAKLEKEQNGLTGFYKPLPPEKCHKLTDTIAGTFNVPSRVHTAGFVCASRDEFTYDPIYDNHPEHNDTESPLLNQIWDAERQAIKQIQRTTREFPVCKFSSQSLELKNDGTNIYWKCSHCKQKNDD